MEHHHSKDISDQGDAESFDKASAAGDAAQGGSYRSWRDAGWQDVAAEEDAEIDLEGQADFERTTFRPTSPLLAQQPASAQRGAHGSHAAQPQGSQAPQGSRSAVTYGTAGSYEYQTVALRQAPDLGKSENLIRVRKKRKQHKVRRAVIIALVCVLVLLGVGVGALALYVNSLNQALSFSDEEELSNLKDVLYTADEADEEDDAFYILILGSDAREEDTASRSDVIMLVRVDPTQGTIHLISIPRDTRIYLEGYGYVKINAAYAYGGAALAVSTVSEFAGVEISHYVEIHFEEFETLVDMMGGVWVDVPVSNTQTGVTNTGVTILAGEPLMDGETALAFARERYGYSAGDYQRTENQRILVTALINQLLDLSAIELPSAIMQLATCVTTDYSVTDILQLALTFKDVDDLTIYSAVTPSSTATISGVSYVIADEEAWAAMMELVDAGEDPNDYDSTDATDDEDATEEEADEAADEAATDEAADADESSDG